MFDGRPVSIYTAGMDLQPTSAPRGSATPKPLRATDKKTATAAEAGSLPTERYTPAGDLGARPTYSGPVLPQPDKSYLVNAEKTPVYVSFDARAIAFFEHIGHKVDLEGAQLIAPDGRSQPLDSRVSPQPTLREQYGLVSGEKSAASNEPWTFRVPGMPGGVFGKPQGVEFRGSDSGLSVKFLDHEGKPLPKLDSGQVADDFQQFRTNTKVLRRNRYSSAKELFGTESGAAQTSGPGKPLVDESQPGLRFQAPTQKSLETLKAGFESVLGECSRTRSESVDLNSLKAFESTFRSLLEREQAEKQEVDGFAVLRQAASHPDAAQQLRTIVGPGSEGLEGPELLEAVRTKVQRACPLEIVVIPRGQSAADCVENADEQTREQLKNAGRAYFHSTDPIAYRIQSGSDDLPPQRLFIGEEVLENETAVKVVYKHEMLHVFEHRYANPEELQSLRASFDEATEFQSLYGSSFSEYLPTVGEEFLAAHGPEGPQWVKEHHPLVYDLLSQLLESDPAASQ